MKNPGKDVDQPGLVSPERIEPLGKVTQGKPDHNYYKMAAPTRLVGKQDIFDNFRDITNRGGIIEERKLFNPQSLVLPAAAIGAGCHANLALKGT